jgi:hypothetical protein
LQGACSKGHEVPVLQIGPGTGPSSPRMTQNKSDGAERFPFLDFAKSYLLRHALYHSHTR